MKKILAFLFTISLFYFVGAQGVLAASNHDVEIRTYLDSSNMNLLAPGLTEKARGSKIQFPPSGISSEYSFAYFAVNDIVRDDLPFTHEFVVRSNMKITAIYHPNGSVTPANARHVVVFADSKNQIIDVQYIVDGEDAIEPTAKLPVLPPFAKYAATKWLTSDNISDLTNIESNRIYFLQYEVDTVTNHTVTVTNGTGSGSYLYNTVVTATPNSAPGEQVFSHWADAEGNVLSYNSNYKFTVLSNVSITAVYAASASPVPVVNMSDALSLRDNFVSYKGQFSLPAGFTLVEYGFIFSRSSDVLTLDSLGATIVPSNVHNGQTGEFLRSFPNDTFNSIRAYLIVKNVAEEEVIFYSQNYYSNQSLSIAQVYQTGFESTEGFIASGIYNNTTINTQGSIGNQWGFYYGTPSTTSPLMGTQSAQMRWYTAAPSNLGYMTSLFAIPNAKEVRFKAQSTFGLDVLVQYSTNGIDFTGNQIFDVTSSTQDFVYNIQEEGYIKFRFSISLPETLPTDTARLYIDSIQVDALQAKHEVKYYDNESLIGSEWVLNGGTIANTNPVKENHIFEGWFEEPGFITVYNNLGIVVESNILYAKFTPAYTIVFNTDGGSHVPNQLVAVGNKVDQPETNPTKDGGFVFAGWYTDATLLTEFDFDNTVVTSNLTIFAKFDVASGTQYSVTFMSKGVVYETQLVDEGANASQPTIPVWSPYTFEGWFVDADGVAPFDSQYNFSSTVTTNITLYAKWHGVITITQSDMTALSGSYNTTEVVFTDSGITFGYLYALKNSTNIQAKSGDFRLYNTASFNSIVSISATQSGTKRVVTMYSGTTVKPTSNPIAAATSGLVDTWNFPSGITHFNLSNSSGNAVYFTQVVITYIPSNPKQTLQTQ